MPRHPTPRPNELDGIIEALRIKAQAWYDANAMGAPMNVPLQDKREPRSIHAQVRSSSVPRPHAPIGKASPRTEVQIRHRPRIPRFTCVDFRDR